MVETLKLEDRLMMISAWSFGFSVSSEPRGAGMFCNLEKDRRFFFGLQKYTSEYRILECLGHNT